ncbi:chromate transporter (plasmid) [Pararobbsia alpina]|uniref:chromate transporter n=1 Tax=Pararobbsia alpina TaxID=621374 RepID=UPI0039A4BFA0
MAMSEHTSDARQPRHHALEVGITFLKLGLTSFGGPIAHIGYFRKEFVDRRRWLDESAFADLVALCQLLPGPASSQVGFAIGLLRAGWAGVIAAWAGFTIPSANLLIGFALFSPNITERVGTGVIHGLKLVAVAVVAQVVMEMRWRVGSAQTRHGR